MIFIEKKEIFKIDNKKSTLLSAQKGHNFKMNDSNVAFNI